MLVQFRMLTQTPEKAEHYDCTGCNGKKHGCLLFNKAVTVEAPMQEKVTVTVNKEDWRKVFEEWNKRIGHARTPELEILMNFNLCPIPLFSDFSLTAYQLFSATEGRIAGSYSDYLTTPNILVEAFNIISSEQAKAINEMRKSHGN